MGVGGEYRVWRKRYRVVERPTSYGIREIPIIGKGQ